MIIICSILFVLTIYCNCTLNNATHAIGVHKMNVVFNRLLKMMMRMYMQCPKLSFYFVHSQGALPLNLCTRKFLHTPSQYIEMINSSKNLHTPGAHLLKSCTLP